MFKYGRYNKDIIILPIYDKKSDEVWSKIVDEKIKEVEPIGSVVLYGSRDSFIPHYVGKHDTVELKPTSMVSASDIRKDVSKRVVRDKNFRAGVIYGAYNNFATVHAVIDVAIMNEDNTEVLLGRKKNEKKFRFIGGFTDVTDDSYEQTVFRIHYWDEYNNNYLAVFEGNRDGVKLKENTKDDKPIRKKIKVHIP